MLSRIAILASMFFMISLPLSSYGATGVTFLAQEFAPFSFHVGKDPSGIMIDLLAELDKRTGRSDHSPEKIKWLPWPRIIKTIDSSKNIAVLGMIRTPSRDALYKWVGPVNYPQNILITQRAKREELFSKYAKNIGNLKTLTNICVVKNDVTVKFLKDLSIPDSNMVEKSRPELCLRMLEKGRVNAFAYDKDVIQWSLKNVKLDEKDFAALAVIKQSVRWIAFSIDVGDDKVALFQQAIDDVREDGTLAKIFEKYIGTSTLTEADPKNPPVP